jgi:hypothetical protein
MTKRPGDHSACVAGVSNCRERFLENHPMGGKHQLTSSMIFSFMFREINCSNFNSCQSDSLFLNVLTKAVSASCRFAAKVGRRLCHCFCNTRSHMVFGLFPSCGEHYHLHSTRCLAITITRGGRFSVLHMSQRTARGMQRANNPSPSRLRNLTHHFVRQE